MYLNLDISSAQTFPDMEPDQIHWKLLSKTQKESPIQLLDKQHACYLYRQQKSFLYTISMLSHNKQSSNAIFPQKLLVS